MLSEDIPRRGRLVVEDLQVRVKELERELKQAWLSCREMEVLLGWQAKEITTEQAATLLGLDVLSLYELWAATQKNIKKRWENYQDG